MSFLKLITFIIKLFIKKLFLRNDLNNPRWFPIKKDGDFYEGFNKPIFATKISWFFCEILQTNFGKNLINFVLNLVKNFLNLKLLKVKFIMKTLILKLIKTHPAVSIFIRGK